MEAQNQSINKEKGQGFNLGVVLGLVIGAVCFWITIMLVKYLPPLKW